MKIVRARSTDKLPYTAIAEKDHDEHLPFRYLLKGINETHIKGLDVQAGDRMLTACG